MLAELLTMKKVQKLHNSERYSGTLLSEPFLISNAVNLLVPSATYRRVL
jgi:hypothetical protein